MDETLYLKRYFPKTFDDVYLPAAIKQTLITKMQKGGYCIMLHSTPGTGKTTTSRLMTLNDNVLYMSGSNDILIDVYRSKILPFCTGFDFEGKQRTLIIDEADGLSKKIQEAFKVVIEKCNTVNFIFLTNDFEKMNDAIKSRAGGGINFNFSGDMLKEQINNFIRFTLDVCKSENLKYDAAGLNYLYTQIFPDFRKLLLSLERLHEMGLDITIDNIKRIEDNVVRDIALYEMIINPAITDKELYEKVSVYIGKEKQVLQSLGEPFFAFLNSKNLHKQTLLSGSIISKYCGIFEGSINKSALLLGVIVELKTLFR